MKNSKNSHRSSGLVGFAKKQIQKLLGHKEYFANLKARGLQQRLTAESLQFDLEFLEQRQMLSGSVGTIHQFGGNEYLVVERGTSAQVQEAAEAVGGNLVSINSQAEQDWITETFQSDGEVYLIGLTDVDSEGEFRWANGDSVTYTNWSNNEPNNTAEREYNGSTEEDAVMLFANGTWNDVSVFVSLPAIVEIEPHEDCENLIENPSFEDGLNGRRRTYNSIEGWNLASEAVRGRTEPKFEINFERRRRPASDGQAYLELDTSRKVLDAIYQDIETEAGQTYELSFDLRANGSRRQEIVDNEVEVWWDGQWVGAYSPVDYETWNSISLTLTASQTGETRLEFRERESGRFGGGDGSGPLLDNVKLCGDKDFVNSPPTINGIPNQSIDEGQLLNIQATATDPDPNQVLTYSLTNGPVGSGIDPVTGVITWATGEIDGPGVFDFAVQVSDGLDSDQTAFTVAVLEVNQSPALAAIQDQVIDENGTLNLIALATDTDQPSNTLTFSLTQAPMGAAIDPVSGEIEWSPTEADGPGVYDFTVQVSDEIATDSVSFTVGVGEVNTAPVLSDINDVTIESGQTIDLFASATDSDDPANDLTYSLVSSPQDASIDPDSGQIQWMSSEGGEFEFIVRVSDGQLFDETSFNVTVTQVEECLFESSAWSFGQSGGAEGDAGSGSASGCGVLLSEGSSFEVMASVDITISDQPQHFVFEYEMLNFDSTDSDSISDAFEVALLDQEGDSLVHTIAADRDSFFNVSEPGTESVSVNALVDGNRISLDLSLIPAGTQATLVFRLVNNDNDTQTSVQINPIEFADGSLNTPVGNQFSAVNAVDVDGIDFSALTDVTGSLVVNYGTTSFNASTNTYYSEITLANNANHPIDGPFVLVVDEISDANVVALQTDGVTLDGDPFYVLDDLFGLGTIEPGATSLVGTLAFLNPEATQFDFELSVLAQPNNAPQFATAPRTQGLVDVEYRYDADAVDLDQDTLNYSLMAGPSGLSVDAETGEVNWSPTLADVGTHSVMVEVADGRGGRDMQQFTIEVKETVPNRPPVIISSPVVETFFVQNADSSDAGVGEFIELTPASVGSDSSSRFSVLPTDDPALFGILGDNVQKVDFDVDPFGNEIPSGSFIATQYESIGLVMNNFQVSSSVFGGPASEPNTTFTPAVTGEALEFQFVVPVAAVGFINTSPDQDPIELLDTEGEVIFSTRDQDDQTSPNFNIDRFLGFIADPSRPIATLRVINNSGNLELDELIFVPVEATYQYQVQAVDPDADPIRFQLDDAPTGMIVNADTGLISWRPVADQVGLHTVVVSADDGRGGVATQEYELRVLADQTNSAPVITSDPVEEFFIPGFSNPASGDVSPQRISLDLGNGETFEGTVSITLPEAAARYADIVLAVDESGSMSGDQAWVAEMIPLLDAALIAEGIGLSAENPNRFAIIGFGGGRDNITVGHFLNSQSRTKYTLYGPDNVVVAEGLFNDVLPDELLNLDLPSDGRYVLVVEAQEATDLIDGIDVGIEGQVGESLRIETLQLGETVDDVIGLPGQQVEYQFDVESETLIYVDSLAKDSRIQWTLEGPSGVVAEDQRFDLSVSSFPLFYRVPAGEYRFTIDSNVDVATDYKFRILDLADSPAIESGENISGEFELKAETFVYQFDVEAGQTFEFSNSTAGVNLLSVWRLIDAQGIEVLREGVGTNQPKITLDSSGTYYLLMESALRPNEGNAQVRVPSTFEFTVTFTDPTPATEIQFGATNSGVIEFVGQFVDYSFALDERSLIYIDSLVNSQISWSLLGPAGEIDSHRFDQTDSFDNGSPVFNLVEGDYVLRIESNGIAGPFDFRVVDLSLATEITPGTSFEGELAVPNETDAYRFDAVAGDEFFIDVVAASDSNNLEYKLIDPFGNPVAEFSDLSAEPMVTTMVDGTYSLLVEGWRGNEGIDTYEINVVPVVTSEANLTLGGVVSGSLATAGQRNVYTFALADDGLLHFDSLTNDSNLVWTLTGPRGVEVESRRFTQSDSYDVGVPVVDVIAGNYQLTVQATNDAIGDFEFRLSDLLDDLQTTEVVAPDFANPAVSFSDSIGGIESILYRFEVQPGDELSFITSVTGSSNVSYRVIDQYGMELFADTGISSNRNNVNFEAGGTYYLQVEGRISNTSPSEFTFDINWIQNNGVSVLTGDALTFGAIISGDLSVASQRDQLVFSLAERSLAYFDAQTNNSAVRWSLRGPSGNVVSNRSFTGTDSFNNSSPVLDLLAGDYQLEIFASSGAPGAYQFQFVDLESADLIQLGTAFDNTLDPANETHFYKFNASAGDAFYFDVEAVSDISNTQYKLVDPFGRVVFISNRMNDTDPVTVDFDGVYTLLVEGWRGNTGLDMYTMNVHRVTNSIDPLMFGQLISGGLTTPGEEAVYSFSLSDWKQLHFDSQTNSSSLNWTLEGPRGTEVASRRFDRSDSANINSPILDVPPGEYTLRVDGVGDTVDSFDFVLIDLANAQAITADSIVTSSLANSSGTAVFQFDVEQGDIVYFDAQGIDGNFSTTPYWRLVDPSGQQLFNVSFATDRGPLTLDAGTYTLFVEGRINDTGANGEFAFELVDLGNALNPVAPSELVFGELISGETTKIFETDRYSFSLDESTRVHFDSFTNDQSLVWSLESNGRTIVDSRRFNISDGSTSIGAVLNLDPGEYVLSVFSTEAEAYGFRLLDLDSATNVAVGDVIDGRFDIPNETDVYRFVATAGERIYVDAIASSAPGSAIYRVIDRFGNTLATGANLVDAEPFEIQESGEYWLVIEARIQQTATNDYQLQLFSTTIDRVNIAVGDSVSGNIETPGDTFEYTFELNEDATIAFDSLTNRSDIVWTLTNPSTVVQGRRFSASDSQATSPILELTSGTYTLTVDGTLDATGEFAFRLIDFASAETISLGTEITGDFGNSRETDVYRFDGSAGQELLFDVVTNGGNLATMRLIDPLGNEIERTSGFNDNGEIQLELTGTYHVLIEATTSNQGTDPYTFNLTEVIVRDEGVLTLGAAVNGLIAIPGEQVSYSFDLDSDSLVHFDSLVNNSQLSWTLAGPRGVEYSDIRFDRSDSTITSNTAALPPAFELRAGEYTLVVDALNGTLADFSFKLINLSDTSQSQLVTPEIGDSAIVSGTQIDPLETQAFRFEAIAGDQFSFDAAPGPNSSHYRVLDAFGTQVFIRRADSDQATIEMPLTGTYYLLVEGNTANASVDTFSIEMINEGNSPVEPLSGESLVLGSVRDGSLSEVGQVDSYRFTLSQRSLLYMDVFTNSSAFRWSLTGPRGVEVGNRSFTATDSFENSDPVLDLIAGEYQLDVFASSGTPGEYGFNFVDLADATVVTPGTAFDDELTLGNETNFYQFDASQGQRFYFDLENVSDANRSQYKLIDPFGQVVFISNRLSDQELVTIPRAGTYTLLVEGRRSNTGVDTYSMNVVPFVQTVRALTSNGVLDASIGSVGEQVVYEFELTEDQFVFVDPVDSVSQLNWTLQGELFKYVDAKRFDFGVEFIELGAGQYTLTIDSVSDFVGDASLIFTVTSPSSQLATDGAITTGRLDSSNGIQVFQFNGNAGEHFALLPDYNMQFTDSATAANTAGNYTAAADPEDGYSGIDVALRADVFREGAAVNYILVTDEDRDVAEDNVTFETLFRSLTAQSALLNMVTTARFTDDTGTRAIGVDSEGNAYIADGNGGFTIESGGITTTNNVSFRQDYIDLAWALDGANWDLGLLRSGGVNAESFTNAFIDVKVEEILEQTNLILTASNTNADFEVISPATGFYDDIVAGQEYEFDIRVGNDGQPIAYDLLFRQGQTIGSIPVFIIAPYQYGASAVDADGDQLIWSIVDGPNGLAIDSATGVLTWPGDSVVFGEHDTTIRVEDGRGGFDEQTFTLDVNGGEAAAIAGSVVFEGGTVDATWTIYLDQNRNGIFDDGELSTTTDINGDYQFDNIDSGSYAVSLVQQPEWVQVLPDGGPIDVFVEAGQTLEGVEFRIEESSLLNTDPRISSEPGLVVTAGEFYEYQPAIVELDGDAIEFDLPLSPAGMVVNPENGTIRWRPRVDQVGIQNVLLRVRDGRGGFDLQYFQIDVQAPNTAPMITSTAPTGPAGLGLPFVYRVRAADAEGDLLTFSLGDVPEGVVINESSGLLQWTPTANQLGLNSISVVVFDDRGFSSEQTFEVEVQVAPVNSDPEILSSGPIEAQLGNLYLYLIEAIDVNGDPITLTLESAPDGMTLDANGLIEWTPSVTQLGQQLVRISAVDGRGGVAIQELTIDVSTQPVNNPPEITSPPLTSAVIDVLYQFQSTAIDANGDSLIWSLEDGPAGMSIDSSTGLVMWEPTISDLGPHNVSIQVLDTNLTGSQLNYVLNVRAVNSPPVILSNPSTEGAVGATYFYQVSANDPDQDPLTFSLTVAPEGMTINAQTGRVAWTPEVGQDGAANVSVTVTDSAGASLTQTYVIEVADGQPNQLPVITSAANFYATVGQLYSYDVQAEDPDNDVLNYALLNAPDGMTINSETGLIEWTPTTADIGSVLVEIAATDQSGGGSLQGFGLQVQATNNVPVINSTPADSVAVGGVYRYDVLASDSDGDFLTYELLSAPSGMVIDGLGRIFWSPTSEQIGISTIEVQVTDVRGATATQDFDVNVEADTTAPEAVILLSSNPINVGELLDIQVSAIDNVSVESIVLTVGGVIVPLDANNTARLQMDTVGAVLAEAMVSDAQGNSVTVQANVFVRDPSDIDGPSLNIVSPADADTITAPTDIIGTVMDDTLVSYRLLLAEFGASNFRQIASGTENVDNGLLGQLDPTLLQNGSYVLRLEAFDASGNGNVLEQQVEITGELKLGNFRLAFTDMVIPVAGIPIEVTRVYDSLESDVEGEIGFGWRLEFRETGLRVDLPSSGLEDYGVFSAYRPGTRVYLNVPGQGRQGFTFDPTLQVLPGFGNSLVLATPRFTPDPGVTSTLSVVNSGNLFVNEFGELSAGGGVPYNPASPDFGGALVLTTRDGVDYRINGLSGKLESATDRNGNVLTFSENGIESSDGRAVSLQRDSHGRITSITDPLGNSITYQYSGEGDLIAVTDREDTTVSFTYSTERPHYLEDIIDPLGRPQNRAVYDAEGRLIQTIDIGGNSVDIEYDPDSSLIRTTNALGDERLTIYDEFGNVVAIVNELGQQTEFEYDSEGNLVQTTSPLGNTTVRAFDSNRNLIEETDALGNISRYSYDSSGNLLSHTNALGDTSTFEYDDNGNLMQATSASGATQSAIYDDRGEVLSFTDLYGAVTNYEYVSGSLTRVTFEDGLVVESVTDANGFVTSEEFTKTSRFGDVTQTWTYTPDGNGELRSLSDGASQSFRVNNEIGLASTLTNSAGLQQDITYDEFGNLARIDNSNGTSTEVRYDVLGREQQVLDQNGNIVVENEYDAAGRNISTTSGGRTTTKEYDADGRVTAVIQSNGDRIDYQYDELGQITQITLNGADQLEYRYDELGRQTSLTFNGELFVETTYNENNQVTRQTYSDGSFESFAYSESGLLLEVANRSGESQQFEYDSFAQIVAIVGNDGARTEYEYDQDGNLDLVRDARGNVTTVGYDGRGQRSIIELPNGQRQTSSIDDQGFGVATQLFDGTQFQYEYDDSGRLVEIFADGTSIRSIDIDGRERTVTTGAGETRVLFNEDGQIQQWINPLGASVTLTGRGSDAVLQTGDVSRQFVVDRGLIRAIQDELNGESFDVQIQYDLEGVPVVYTLPDDSTLSRSINLQGLTEQISYANSLDEVLEQLTYDRAIGGDISSISYLDGSNRTLTYDSAGRLEREVLTDGAEVSVREYTYDAAGNRVSQTIDGVNVTLTYNELDQIVGNGTDSYSHDGLGNLTEIQGADSTQTFEYDVESRLTSYQNSADGNGQVEYTYDTDGLLLSRSYAGQTQQFVWDRQTTAVPMLLEIHNGNGQLQRRFVHDGARYLASIDSDGNTTNFVTDNVGSVVAGYDEQGNKVLDLATDAFGVLDSGLDSVELGFAGGIVDSVSGLVYLRARWYDPSTGRFIQRDPAEADYGDPRTLHRYVYSLGDPVNNLDNDGFFTVTEQQAILFIKSTLAVIGVGAVGTLATSEGFLRAISGGRLNFRNQTGTFRPFLEVSLGVSAKIGAGASINGGFVAGLEDVSFNNQNAKRSLFAYAGISVDISAGVTTSEPAPDQLLGGGYEVSYRPAVGKLFEAQNADQYKGTFISITGGLKAVFKVNVGDFQFGGSKGAVTAIAFSPSEIDPESLEERYAHTKTVFRGGGAVGSGDKIDIGVKATFGFGITYYVDATEFVELFEFARGQLRGR